MGFLDKVKGGQSIEESAAEHVLLGETGTDDNEKPCCDLDWKTRVIGFAACFVIGMIMNWMSIFGIFDLAFNPAKFAVIYTIGNALSLLSTCFLWSPRKQTKSMFENKDVGLASVLFICCMITTIVLVIIAAPWYAILPIIIVQFLSSMWYTLSFFPRIRKAMLRCIGRCICGAPAK